MLRACKTGPALKPPVQAIRPSTPGGAYSRKVRDSRSLWATGWRLQQEGTGLSESVGDRLALLAVPGGITSQSGTGANILNIDPAFYSGWRLQQDGTGLSESAGDRLALLAVPGGTTSQSGTGTNILNKDPAFYSGWRLQQDGTGLSESAVENITQLQKS
ncbi:hypothetical protein RRG08_026351 [Elysia crispata]|uniref:Uncharacterized protein n=1 Tax=Elysia crispata TaxID=231223 RepID=A0AAE0XNQ3_9GAST|nr:hypothetical protein RRG08_026351 [Elysia crispata]